jgi:hypothetical protein
VVVKQQGKLPTQGSMKVIMKSLGGKGCKLHVGAEETLSSVKAKASKKLGCQFFFSVVKFLISIIKYISCHFCSVPYFFVFRVFWVLFFSLVILKPLVD